SIAVGAIPFGVPLTSGSTITDEVPFSVTFPYSASVVPTDNNGVALDTIVTLILTNQVFTDTTQAATSGTLALTFAINIDGSGYILKGVTDGTSNSYTTALVSGQTYTAMSQTTGNVPFYGAISCKEQTSITVTASICPGTETTCSGAVSTASLTIQVDPDMHGNKGCGVTATIGLTDLSAIISESGGALGNAAPTAVTSAKTLHIGNFWNVAVSSLTLAGIGSWIEITSIRLSYISGSNTEYFDVLPTCALFHKYTAAGSTWFSFQADQLASDATWTTAATSGLKPATSITPTTPDYVNTCQAIPMQLNQAITMTIGLQFSQTQPSAKRRDSSPAVDSVSKTGSIAVQFGVKDSSSSGDAQVEPSKSSANTAGLSMVAGALALLVVV
ncbi:hypothetical protein HDU98_003623, partial [Podochytrium sp. JEL0797]